MKKYKLYVALLLFSIYTFVTGEIEYQEIKENPKSVVNKIIADKSKENTKLNIKVNKLKITPIKLPPLVDRDENGNSYFLFDFPKEDTKHKYFVTDDLNSIPRKNIVNNKEIQNIDNTLNGKKETKKLEFMVKYGILNEYDEFVEKNVFSNDETPLEVVWVKRDENLTGEYVYIAKLDSENEEVMKIYSHKIPRYKVRSDAPNLNENPGDMTYMTFEDGTQYHSTDYTTPVFIGKVTSVTITRDKMIPDTTKRTLKVSGEILHRRSSYGSAVLGVYGGIRKNSGDNFIFRRGANDVAVGSREVLRALKLDGSGTAGLPLEIDGTFRVRTAGTATSFKVDEVGNLGGEVIQAGGDVYINKIYGTPISRIYNGDWVWGTDGDTTIEADYTFNLGTGIVEPGYYQIPVSILPREIIIGKYNDTKLDVKFQQLLDADAAKSFQGRGPAFEFLATRPPIAEGEADAYLVLKDDDNAGGTTSWNSLNEKPKIMQQIGGADGSIGVSVERLLAEFGYGRLIAKEGTISKPGNSKFDIIFSMQNSSVLYPVKGTKRGVYPISIYAGTLKGGSTTGEIQHKLITPSGTNPGEDIINLYYIESIDNSDISVNFFGSPVGTWGRWNPGTVNKTANGQKIEKGAGDAAEVVFKKNSGIMLYPLNNAGTENHISGIKVEVENNLLVPEVKELANKKWAILLKNKQGEEIAEVGFEGKPAGEFYVVKKARDLNKYKIKITPMDNLPNPQKWGTITLNLQLDEVIDLGMIGVELYNSLHTVMLEKGQTWLKLSGGEADTASIGNGANFIAVDKLTHINFNSKAENPSEFAYSTVKGFYEVETQGTKEVATKLGELYDVITYQQDSNNSLFIGDSTPKGGLDALKSIAIDLKNIASPSSSVIVNNFRGSEQIDVYLQGKNKNYQYKAGDAGDIYKVKVAVLFLPTYEGKRFKIETPVDFGTINIPFYYKMINVNEVYYKRDLGNKKTDHLKNRKLGDEIPEKNLAYGKKVDSFYVKTKILEETNGNVVEIEGDEGLGGNDYIWIPGHRKYKLKLGEFGIGASALEYYLERNAKTHEIVTMSVGVNVPSLGFIKTSSGEMEIKFGELKEVAGDGFVTFNKLPIGTIGTWEAKELIEVSKKYPSKENNGATFELFSGELFKDNFGEITKVKIIKKVVTGDIEKEVTQGAEADFGNVAITYSKNGTFKIRKLTNSTELEKYSLAFYNNTLEVANFNLVVQIEVPDVKSGTGEANMKAVKAPTIGRWSIDGIVGTPNQNLNTTGNMEFTLKSGVFYTSGDTSKIKIIKEDGTIVEGKPNAEIELGDTTITVDTGRRQLYIRKNSDVEGSKKYTIETYKEVNRVEIKEGSFALDVILGEPPAKIGSGTLDLTRVRDKDTVLWDNNPTSANIEIIIGGNGYRNDLSPPGNSEKKTYSPITIGNITGELGILDSRTRSITDRVVVTYKNKTYNSTYDTGYQAKIVKIDNEFELWFRSGAFELKKISDNLSLNNEVLKIEMIDENNIQRGIVTLYLTDSSQTTNMGKDSLELTTDYKYQFDANTGIYKIIKSSVNDVTVYPNGNSIMTNGTGKVFTDISSLIKKSTASANYPSGKVMDIEKITMGGAYVSYSNGAGTHQLFQEMIGAAVRETLGVRKNINTDTISNILNTKDFYVFSFIEALANPTVAANIVTKEATRKYVLTWRSSENLRYQQEFEVKLTDKSTIGSGAIDISNLTLNSTVAFENALTTGTPVAIKEVREISGVLNNNERLTITSPVGYFLPLRNGTAMKFVVKNGAQTEEISNTGSTTKFDVGFTFDENKLSVTKTKNLEMTTNNSYEIEIYQATTDSNSSLREYLLLSKFTLTIVNNLPKTSATLDLTKVRKNDKLVWSGGNSNTVTSSEISTNLISKDGNGVKVEDRNRTYAGVDFVNTDISKNIFFSSKKDEIKKIGIKFNNQESKSTTNLEVTAINGDFKIGLDSTSKLYLEKLKDKVTAGSYELIGYDRNDNQVGSVVVEIADSTEIKLTHRATVIYSDGYRFLLPADYGKVEYFTTTGFLQIWNSDGTINKSANASKLITLQVDIDPSYTAGDLAADILGVTNKVLVQKTPQNKYIYTDTGSSVKGLIFEPLTKFGETGTTIKFGPITLDSSYITTTANTYEFIWRTALNTDQKTTLSVKKEEVAEKIGAGTLDFSTKKKGESIKWSSSYSINTKKSSETSTVSSISNGTGELFPTKLGVDRFNSSYTSAEIGAETDTPIKTLTITKNGDSNVLQGNILNGKISASNDEVEFGVENGEFYVKKLKPRITTATYTIVATNDNGKLGTLTLTLQDNQLVKSMGTVTYKILPSLKSALLKDTNREWYIGGANGKVTYSYNSAAKAFNTGAKTFNEYLERESTIVFPTDAELKFVGVELNKTSTTAGIAFTKESAGIYKDGNAVALGLSSTIESSVLTTLDSLAIDEIKLNMLSVRTNRYSVVFLNEKDGDIYYYDVALAEKTANLSAAGKVALDGVAANTELEFDISGKGVGSYLPTNKNTPALQITAGQVVYFAAGTTFIPQKIRYNNIDYSITTNGTKKEIVIEDEFNKFVIRDGKFYLTKKKISLEDKNYIFNFLGVNNEELGMLALLIPKEVVVEKNAKVTIKDRAFTENPNFDLINLTTMTSKAGINIKDIEGQDLVKFEMIPNNAEDKMVGVSSIQKISNEQTDLTKGTDVKGMENYGDKIYISKTGMGSIVKISDLMKSIYLDKAPLELNQTEMSKANNYSITYIGVDNRLYKLNIVVETVKSVMVDGKAILDFGKLLYDSNSDFHYGETTVKVVGINKDKRVRVALQTENIELLSTTDATQKMNVKNLGVELITPIPMASNKTISKEAQSNGEATFRIYGNAEVLKTTPVGKYSGVATVDVYILD